MKEFTINSNEYLSQDIQGYYHQDYLHYQEEGNPDFINDLKNQFGDTDDYVLNDAKKELKQVFKEDLKEILKRNATKTLTVCVVPRAKYEDYYEEDQKMFRESISEVTNKFNGLINGTKYIVRHTSTMTTHMRNSGYEGYGDAPYKGITKETCHISKEIQGKDILLIDDVYTKTVNIDEDAIQTLLNNGAKSVIFYAVGKTKDKGIGESTDITVTVKYLKFYPEYNNYRININERIDGFRRVEGEYVESKVSYLNFKSEKLQEQCLKNIAELRFIYKKKQEQAIMEGRDININFDSNQLGLFLHGAKLEIERTKFISGDEYTTADGEIHIYEYSGYTTNIKSITITKKTRELLDRVLKNYSNNSNENISS